MIKKRDVILFLAGAEAFHTFSHILLYFNGLPITFYSIVVTPQINMWAIVINALITAWLLWWFKKLK